MYISKKNKQPIQQSNVDDGNALNSGGTKNQEIHHGGVSQKGIERKLITYIENAPSGIFITDEKGNYVLVNKAATVISGYSKIELLKMNRLQLIHPKDHAKATESFTSLFEVGNAALECCFLTKKGEERFWKVNAIKIQGNRYMSIVNNITDQKQAEEELKRTNKYLETIFENIPDMLYLKDAKDLNFVQFNKTGEDLTGYSRSELLGKNDFDFYPKEQAEFSRKKSREVLDAKSPLFIE